MNSNLSGYKEELARIYIKRLRWPTREHERPDREQLFGLNYTAYPDDLVSVGTHPDILKVRRRKQLFRVTAINEDRRTITVRVSHTLHALCHGKTIRIHHPSYGEFELTLTGFTHSI
jgi:hypothetical protein